jgi:hypothetical protein
LSFGERQAAPMQKRGAGALACTRLFQHLLGAISFVRPVSTPVW